MDRGIQDVPIVHFGSPVGTQYREDKAAEALVSLRAAGWIEKED